MPPAVAAQKIAVRPRRGVMCSDMPEARAKISPSQPNEAMARVAPRRNDTISLDPSCVGSKFPRKVLLIRFEIVLED
jgi:hypothetical protein